MASNKVLIQKTIEVLQILKTIENPEIIKCTLESLLEELLESQSKISGSNKGK